MGNTPSPKSGFWRGYGRYEKARYNTAASRYYRAFFLQAGKARLADLKSATLKAILRHSHNAGWKTLCFPCISPLWSGFFDTLGLLRM